MKIRRVKYTIGDVSVEIEGETEIPDNVDRYDNMSLSAFGHVCNLKERADYMLKNKYKKLKEEDEDDDEDIIGGAKEIKEVRVVNSSDCMKHNDMFA